MKKQSEVDPFISRDIDQWRYISLILLDNGMNKPNSIDLRFDSKNEAIRFVTTLARALIIAKTETHQNYSVNATFSTMNYLLWARRHMVWLKIS